MHEELCSADNCRVGQALISSGIIHIHAGNSRGYSLIIGQGSPPGIDGGALL